MNDPKIGEDWWYKLGCGSDLAKVKILGKGRDDGWFIIECFGYEHLLVPREHLLCKVEKVPGLLHRFNKWLNKYL